MWNQSLRFLTSLPALTSRHGGCIFLSPFLSSCPFSLGVFFFCPSLHARLLLKLLSPSTKCGKEWKRELESSEKQPCFCNNVPNTNVRWEEMPLTWRFPCGKTGDKKRTQVFSSLLWSNLIFFTDLEGLAGFIESLDFSLLEKNLIKS